MPPSAINQSESLGVQRGNGDGTFAPGEHYALDTPYWPRHSLQAADVNCDQIVDLIVRIPFSDVTTAPEVRPFSVIVRLGHGDCTFGPAIGLDAGEGVTHVLTQDLDGDDIPDLAVAANERVSIFHGNGDGSFSDRQDFAVGGTPTKMAVTDWNSDGLADLVVADAYLHLLLGSGGGHFAPAIDCALSLSDSTTLPNKPPVMADFDGDGTVDLAVGNAILFGMHECNGTRQTTYAAPRPPYYDRFTPLSAGDFDGDGTVDLVFVSDDAIEWVPGDGHGGFGEAAFLADLGSEGAYEFATTAGDLNGDGRLDLIVTSNADIRMLVNTCQ